MSECICGSDNGLHIKECPLWENPFQEINDLITNQQREIDMLNAENALKLTQILGLEQLIWEMRTPRWNDKDGSPCWCGEWKHTDVCNQARQATEPFWKK